MNLRADSLCFAGPMGTLPVFPSETFGQLDIAHLTSVPPRPDLTEVSEILVWHARFLQQLQLAEDRIKILRTRDDVPRQYSDIIHVLLGLQRPPYLNKFSKNSAILADKVNLGALFDQGIRVIQLAYDEASPFAGGYACDTNFSPGRGYAFLDSAIEVGLIPDLSHLNQKSALAVAEVCDNRNPFMVSHAGLQSVYSHPRNLPDDVCARICSSGGYYGIPTCTWMLGPEGDDTLEPFWNHINHALDIAGCDCVGIGSDGYYVENYDVAEAQTRKMLGKISPDNKFGVRFPDHPVETFSPDKIGVIEQFLSDKGMSGRLVDKVCGDNFAAFLRRALPRK